MPISGSVPRRWRAANSAGGVSRRSWRWLATRRREPPQGQVHLDGDVVRHAAQHGVDLVRAGDALEQRGRQRGGEHPGHDRPHDRVGAVARCRPRLHEAQPVGGGTQVGGGGGPHPQPASTASNIRVRAASRTGQRPQDPHHRAAGRPQRRRPPVPRRAGAAAGRGEPGVGQHVLHHRLGARPEVDRQELHQPLAGRPVPREVGQVAVEAAADVDDSGDPHGSRARPSIAAILSRLGRHAHRGDRPQHALDVPELQVDAGEGPAAGGGAGNRW